MMSELSIAKGSNTNRGTLFRQYSDVQITKVYNG